MIDEQSIEGWKFELALAATTRTNIKALIVELEEVSDESNGSAKYTVDLILSKVKKLDEFNKYTGDHP